MLETYDAQYQPLFAFYPYGIARIDRHGIILETNTALSDRSGFARESLVGHHIREFTTAETSARADELVAELHEGKSAWRELRLVHASGTPLARRCTVVPTASSKEPGHGFIVIQDITGEVQAQQFMRSLFDHHPHGIARLDLDGTVSEVNDAPTDLSGYKRDELLGKHFTDFAGPQTSSMTAELLDRTFKGQAQSAYVHPVRKTVRAETCSLRRFPCGWIPASPAPSWSLMRRRRYYARAS